MRTHTHFQARRFSHMCTQWCALDGVNEKPAPDAKGTQGFTQAPDMHTRMPRPRLLPHMHTGVAFGWVVSKGARAAHCLSGTCTQVSRFGHKCVEARPDAKGTPSPRGPGLRVSQHPKNPRRSVA